MLNMEPELIVAQSKKIDPMLYGRFEDLFNSFLQKYSESASIEKLHVTVDAHRSSHKLSDREKYSLRVMLITPKKVFNANSHAWDLIDATHLITNKLEKQLISYHEKTFKSIRPKIRLMNEQENIEE